MEFKSSGLKDISNLGCNPQPQNQGTLVNLKAMVAPVQKVTMEDKENFDPRSATTTTTLISTTSKKASQTTEKIENEANSVMQDADSDISSDGFDVSEGLELDEASLSDDENSQGLPSHTKVQNENSSKEAPAPSPLVMNSLLCNKVVFNIEDDNDDNGASPMFSQPSLMRQERRKLDFSNVENITSPVTSNKPGRFRRCLSMVENRQAIKLNTSSTSPEMVRSFKDDMTSPLSRPIPSFKRPNTLPLGNSQKGNQILQPANKKLRRCESLKVDDSNSRSMMTSSMSMPTIDSPQISRPFLQMSLNSLSEANIKKACSLADEPNLTGDRSRKLSLPTISGLGSSNAKQHINVDCHTLADLIKGKYSDKIASFRIIDARYPYEYHGGHIRGAENFGFWDETESFLKEFLPPTLEPRKSVPGEDEKAHILIFHCEFSSERGPKLMSTLRNKDREHNRNTFPALHYPECYLLSEGYKKFYANYPDLCEPKGYVQMKDSRYAEEEKKFHRKSKSWAPGSTMSRAGSSSRLRKL